MGKREKLSLNVDSDGGSAVLAVLAPLDAEDADSFSALCEEMLAAKANELVIELHEVSTIRSLFYGLISYLHFEAEKAGKSLTVRCNEETARGFKLFEFDKYLTMEIV